MHGEHIILSYWWNINYGVIEEPEVNYINSKVAWWVTGDRSG